jgi:maltooligosyltrehalose trehalohydrolase
MEDKPRQKSAEIEPDFKNPRDRLGAAWVEGEGVHVRLWAPKTKAASVVWGQGPRMPLHRDDDGYHTGVFPDAKPGSAYQFYLHDAGRLIPDPASRFQPEDVFGASAVVTDDYPWTDSGWQGVPFDQWVIYEVHVGTFSESHDFRGVIDDLPRLKSLGVNVIELMPVAQFPGSRNWGYDGVFPHAVQHSYGGPAGLKKLVDSCHAAGIAIILDVVYNHLGPEGNVLPLCGPYVEESFSLPWGQAINFAGKDSVHVRRYFLQNVWQWLTEYHLDGLRLDAIQSIYDPSATPFLEEVIRLGKKAEDAVGRPLVLIAESDANDARILGDEKTPGFAAHWADDYHHALHATLTGEDKGYYSDYGGIEQLAHILRRGVLFEGQYSPYRKRRHGRSYEGIARNRLVVELQNHDQIGNREHAERIAALIGIDRARLGAAAVLLSPFTPLIFMGEEWGATVPFHYFLSFHDQAMTEKIHKNRPKEWEDFGWQTRGADPGAIDTFEKSVLRGKAEACRQNEETVAWYRGLIALSKRIRRHERMEVAVDEGKSLIVIDYALAHENLQVVLSFSDVAQPLGGTENGGRLVFGTVDEGLLPPYGVAVYEGASA